MCGFHITHFIETSSSIKIDCITERMEVVPADTMTLKSIFKQENGVKDRLNCTLEC